MGIPLKRIKQNCCDSHLSTYTIIDGDSLDNSGSTCDKIIECTDKYILIEEKSILISFFHKCCQEESKNFEDYKYKNEEIEYLNIDNIVEMIHSMSIEVKKRILSECIVELTATSAKKASNTTHILMSQYDSSKTKDMKVFYLYCNSGKPFDMILHTLLRTYKKLMFIECNKLIEKLEQGCA